MEIAQPRIDIESRFRTVNLASLKNSHSHVFHIRVAGIVLQIAFDSAWPSKVPDLCRQHWSSFLCQNLQHQVKIVLSPADGEFVNQNNEAWNISSPFQERVDDPTGSWLFHRDFTCLVRDGTYHAWLPSPTEIFTDALDNILAMSLRPMAEKRESFLFHASVIEHDNRAVVFFGPSGIGKSTLAKLSLDCGFRVMSSDQVYLRIEHFSDGPRLLASASPTCNPDIPRNPACWVTDTLQVKALFALKRKGTLDIQPLARSEMTRRFFAEVFRDEADNDFAPALKFACDVVMVNGISQASLSYPFSHNFWPELKKLGYI